MSNVSKMRLRDCIHSRSLVFTFILAVGALNASTLARAETNNPSFTDDWRIYIGVFSAITNSEVQVNGTIQPVITPKIKLEDVLGVDDSKSVGWGGVEWRIAGPHSMEMEIFTLSRKASKMDTFDSPIRLGDMYLEGGRIATSYDTDVVRLTYNYAW